jgi:signal transduction histidine kinase
MTGDRAVPEQRTSGQFDDAVETMRHPFVILSPDERLVTFNRAYAELHRGPDGACVLRPGMSFREVAEWRLANGFYLAATGAGADGSTELFRWSTAKGETTYRLSDGRWMAVERYPLPDGTNLGIWIDITAVKEAEQQLREAAELLERRVAERTAELQQAQAQLVERERLSIIGQLTATVAHELRNPLSSIRNTVFSLRQTEAGKAADAERSLARIERSIGRCTRIIGELLDYSRLRELRCERRGFDDWLREVIAEQAAPRSVAIAWDLRAGAAVVSFDPDRFRQVIVNLFENAVQAMTEAAPGVESSGVASPTITLRTRMLGQELEFALEDNGPGIGPETLARVFEPLFSTKHAGTGLGLPTVKQIVEQHGGAITLASTIGAGTRALIRLKLAQDAAAA